MGHTGMKEHKRSNKQLRILFLSVILSVFLVFSLISIQLVQRTISTNSQVMGQEIARSFSTSEDANLYAYELLLRNATQWLSGQLEEGKSREEVQHWMEDYLSYVSDTLGSKGIDMCASIGGQILAATYWEGDDTFDPTAQNWYQMAMAADGDIIYTDAYNDVVTGLAVITIAQRIGNTNDVLAIDLFPQHFQQWSSMEALPADSSYFLCDSTGTVLCYDTNGSERIEDVQSYVDQLNEEIDAGIHADTEFSFLKGNDQYGVYYRQTSNGWTSIITLPYRYLFSGLNELALWYAGIFGLFLLLSAIMYLRERRLNQQVELTSETVRVLGDSYYAIYRINFESETYTMLKSEEPLFSALPHQGDYTAFLAQLKEVIEPQAYAEFEDSFSIASIRRLVERKVRDYGGDFQRLFPEGYRWVNVRLLFDDSLDVGEAILCFREVDEEKRRQLQHTELLKESLLTMQKSAEARNLFFANMSHDMRTPLNAIIGMSDLAGHTLSDPERTGDYLRKINHSSKHLLGLINDVLEMSKCEQGKLALERRPFDLREQLDEVLDIFRIQAQNEGKEFHITYDVRNTRVEGDFFRIQQILNNLLSNALKFTSPGQEISLTVRQLDEGVHTQYQFIVQDTGVGMSEEFLSRIFIPFERETRFGAKNVSGTGLGMPIVRNIVLQMEGQIDVQSALGKGSTFTVTIPLALQAGAEEETTPAPAPVEAANLQGRRLLLAEDNELNMELATEVLRMKGVEVVQAWNGREAVERFQESAPGFFDAILMDMQMPEMNGCEAARAIRALPRTDASSVPIIAVTANAFAEDIAATVAAGMNAHIAKPIDFDLLEQTLGRLLVKA